MLEDLPLWIGRLNSVTYQSCPKDLQIPYSSRQIPTVFLREIGVWVLKVVWKC